MGKVAAAAPPINYPAAVVTINDEWERCKHYAERDRHEVQFLLKVVEKLAIEDWSRAESWLTDQIKTYYMVLKHGWPHAIKELRATKKDDAGLVMTTSPPANKSSSSSSSSTASKPFQANTVKYRSAGAPSRGGRRY